MPVTPQYRRWQQQYYLDASMQEAGVSHLWHAQRLAEARLRASKGITDAPEVDFRRPELMDRDQARASALMTRLQRRVLAEEARLVKENTNLYEHLINASDVRYRGRRGMNNLPSPEELKKWYRREEHMLDRQRGRVKKDMTTRKENYIILQHLVNTQPVVTPAKQLSHWYHHEHKKRVRRLRRFQRTEPFAGAAVLREECKIILPEEICNSARERTAAQEPALRGQYKIPTLIGTLHAGPLIPSLYEASENYINGNLTLDEDYDFTASWTQRRKEKKPAWKNISALDVTLMNYASDLMLARGGELPVIRPEEENSITRLWREGIEKHHRAMEREKNAIKERCGTADMYKSKENNKRTTSTTVKWDPNRWKSRRSILTELRDQNTPRRSMRRSQSLFNSIENTTTPRGGEITPDKSSRIRPSLGMKTRNDDQSLLEMMSPGPAILPGYGANTYIAGSYDKQSSKTQNFKIPLLNSRAAEVDTQSNWIGTNGNQSHVRSVNEVRAYNEHSATADGVNNNHNNNNNNNTATNTSNVETYVEAPQTWESNSNGSQAHVRSVNEVRAYNEHSTTADGANNNSNRTNNNNNNNNNNTATNTSNVETYADAPQAWENNSNGSQAHVRSVNEVRAYNEHSTTADGANNNNNRTNNNNNDNNNNTATHTSNVETYADAPQAWESNNNDNNNIKAGVFDSRARRVRSNDIHCEESYTDKDEFYDEKVTNAFNMMSENRLDGRQTLADWTNELRHSSGPFVPY